MTWVEENLNTIILGDCLDIMKNIPDKSIDLLLTDPPYGIDFVKQRFDKTKARNLENKGWGWREVELKDWDKERPSKEYFDEMLRVSKNQIIWGGNYFIEYLSSSQGWFVWNKGQRNFSLADGELAWTSYNRALRIFDYARAKQLNEEIREHPTQKPVKLIEWCLQRAKLNEDAIVLDCFSGSGTTAIACHNQSKNFICIEKDVGYWKTSVERLEIAQAQLNLFVANS